MDLTLAILSVVLILGGGGLVLILQGSSSGGGSPPKVDLLRQEVQQKVAAIPAANQNGKKVLILGERHVDALRETHIALYLVREFLRQSSADDGDLLQALRRIRRMKDWERSPKDRETLARGGLLLAELWGKLETLEVVEARFAAIFHDLLQEEDDNEGDRETLRVEDGVVVLRPAMASPPPKPPDEPA